MIMLDAPLQLIDLLKLDRKSVISVFCDLAAPEIREMHGEYRASLLDQGRWAHNFFVSAAFHLPGVWLSKSFCPTNDFAGRGYNSFRSGRDVKKIYRMKTYLGPSRWDGGRSYVLNYGIVEHQHRLPLLTKLSGEIRRVRDGLYLGLGVADFGISMIRREQPFILEGPVAAYDESVWASETRQANVVAVRSSRLRVA